MRKILTLICLLLVCAASADAATKIKITAGDIILQGVLFDNEQARGLAELLPMTVPLYEPADFAKALNLPHRLAEPSERTRQYKIGGIAYWHEGPAVAMFFSDHYAQTVVPVVSIGEIFEGAEKLRNYDGEIVIEQVGENRPN